MTVSICSKMTHFLYIKRNPLSKILRFCIQNISCRTGLVINVLINVRYGLLKPQDMPVLVVKIYSSETHYDVLMIMVMKCDRSQSGFYIAESDNLSYIQTKVYYDVVVINNGCAKDMYRLPVFYCERQKRNLTTRRYA